MLRSLLNKLAPGNRKGAGKPRPSAPINQPSPLRGKVDTVKYEIIGRTMVATVLDPELTAPKVAELTSELQANLEKHENVPNLVVDLQNVEYLDSSCLYMLVHLLERVKANGGQIAVAKAQHRVEGIFKLTRLDSVFPIKASVVDAIEVLERAAAA
jgi:anti-sigma B factor antagonist